MGNTNAMNIIAMAEAIGENSPIADDEGKLTESPQTARNYNPTLRHRKPPVEINDEYINKRKDEMLAGKSIVELAEKIGGAGLEGENIYNQDLDTVSASRNKAYSALIEAIQVLSESDIDYWCPDEATRTAAPKIRAILQKFASRLQ